MTTPVTAPMPAPMPARRGRRMRVAVAGLLLLLLVAACGFLPFDQAALGEVDKGWQRALLSFAAARALNAAISVAQGTEVSLQVGAGVTLAPGQMLDPINDLVEQVSTLLLFAAASFGVQRLLITVGSAWPVSVALVGVGLAWACWMWRHPASTSIVSRLLSRALVMLLLVRFLVPVVVVGNEAVYRHFFADEYQAAQDAMATSPAVFEQAAPAGDESWWRRLAAAVDVKQRLEALKAKVDELAGYAVRLVVVFTLQTLVMPLLLGWAVLRLARALFTPRD